MSSTTFSIGELAARSGCKVPTIRYYESIGLIAPSQRTDGGHRLYGDEDARRLAFIRGSRELGFTLEMVRSLLDLASDRDRPCSEVDAIASTHFGDIERKIESLTSMRDALADLIDQCRHTTVLECRIIDALSPAGA